MQCARAEGELQIAIGLPHIQGRCSVLEVVKMKRGTGLLLAALLVGACTPAAPTPSEAEFQATIQAAVATAIAQMPTATPTPTLEPTATPVPTPTQPTEPTPIVLTVEFPTPTSTPTATPTPGPRTAIGLTRLRPAPVGFGVVLEDERGLRAIWTRVTQVVQGEEARAILQEAGTEHWPLPQGSEYLLTYIESEILRTPGEEQKGMDEFVFNLISEDGLQLMDVRPLLAIAPPPVYLGIGYPGVEIEGWVLWHVPKGMKGAILRLGPYAFDSSAAWFSTQVPGQMDVLVKSVTDGDTFQVELIDGASETLQLHSVQTATANGGEGSSQETDPLRGNVSCQNGWAETAARYAREMLEGQRVTIEFDPLTSDRNDQGHLLAYILTEDEDFGGSLIERGYARTRLMGQAGGREASYLLLQSRAQQEDRGIWRC